MRFTLPPLGEAGQRFQDWLGSEYQGEMSYLAHRKAERISPERLLSEIQSVIVVAHPYDSGLENSHDPKIANLSRYAWGEDYHEVLRDKLLDFQAWLAARIPQLACFVSVDSSPVLEKGWAEKAGLGWMGKHTNIIDANTGSYFFLSVLLTNLPFTPDEETPNRCGSCEACIEVCPTRAIVAPYVLDARLCISYLTIELKGAIPRHLRTMIGNRVFGCDDCQEVCPWNRFSKPTEEGRFMPREGLRGQPLESFLSLDEAGFKKKFAGSAVLRAKRKGFLRNVCVAIGNSGAPELAKSLLPMLRDPEALVRGHAVWAYARLLGAGAREELKLELVGETDPFVLVELNLALHSPELL